MTSLDRLTDEQLLARRDAPHAAASFSVFYLRYERAVLAFHARRAGDAEVAADLMAETFAQAIRSRARFKGTEPGDGAAWLFGIAAHTYSRHVRSSIAERRRDGRLFLERPPLNHEQRDAIAALAGAETVTELLAALPAEQRAAVQARIVDDIDYDEIAARSGVSESTVRKRVSRGLAALRSSTKESA